tara:strand:- start:3862 stop:4422 length:561 start_codon:yes stop_codon:yes gene_type:complete
MSLQIYKPNKSNTGSAFSFSMGYDKKTNEPTLFVSAIMQHSWDESKKRGSFIGNKETPDKNVTLKFNEFECGSIINSIKNRFTYETFHKFENNKTVIKFTPWDKQSKISKFNPSTKSYVETTEVIPAFGMTIIKNGNLTFKISIEPGEAECLSSFLKTVLGRIYKHRITRPNTNKKQPTEEEECPI